MHAKPELSVVVPVYNSAATLPTLVDRLARVLDASGKRYEMILVDDGSADSSWNTLTELHFRHPQTVVAIQLMRNYGQHNALMCGFRHARGHVIITLDDDLQNPPEEIPKLLERIEAAQEDVVYGLPILRRDRTWRRLASLPIQYFIQRSIGLPGPVSAFRAMRRPLIEAILRYDLNYTFVDGLISWNTRRIAFVDVLHHPRTTGRSGYSLRRLFLHAVNIITNFSLIPLQIASVVGLIAAVLGLVLGAYYLIQSLFDRITVPGYASTIVAILTLGGIQLLALGVIGEYLGRMHLNINHKPQFTVRDKLEADGHDS